MNNEQQAKNLVFSKEQDFFDRTKVTKQSFSLFFDRMLKKLKEHTGQAQHEVSVFRFHSSLFWS
jgi:hypothetical protein